MPTDTLGREVRPGHRLLYAIQTRGQGIRLTEFVVTKVQDDRIYFEGGPLKMIHTPSNTVVIGRKKK